MDTGLVSLTHQGGASVLSEMSQFIAFGHVVDKVLDAGFYKVWLYLLSSWLGIKQQGL